MSVLLAAAAVSAAPPPPLPPGNYSQTIRSGDLDRHAIFHVPLGYDGRRPLPLVFVLHGFGGTAASMVNSTGLNAKADAEGFFVAYLDGMPCVPLPGSPCDGSQQGWNNGLTAGAGITADDVGFVRDALRHFQARVRVDIRRVYAAGLSNGAMMCHRLAAELSD
ncbi:MAG TPA: PHB depolymerase family esterase, partial [Vicinamibacteria bacterium]|nr:PHB depolymerase family esterase [Vicinamibacteria bacterium]